MRLIRQGVLRLYEWTPLYVKVGKDNELVVLSVYLYGADEKLRAIYEVSEGANVMRTGNAIRAQRWFME